MKPCRGGHAGGTAGSSAENQLSLCCGLVETMWELGAGQLHICTVSTVAFSLACRPLEGRCWIGAHPLLRSGAFGSVQPSDPVQSGNPCRGEKPGLMSTDANLETGKFSDSGAMRFIGSVVGFGEAFCYLAFPLAAVAAAPLCSSRGCECGAVPGLALPSTPGATGPAARRLRLRGRAGSHSLSLTVCFVSLHRSWGRSTGRLPSSAPRKRCHRRSYSAENNTVPTHRRLMCRTVLSPPKPLLEAAAEAERPSKLAASDKLSSPDHRLPISHLPHYV